MRQTRLSYAILFLTLVFVWAGNAKAQKRDPLNEKEVDQMRESADWPDKRLEFMVKFARARMDAVQQLQANATTSKDRPRDIHDLLEDFTTLLDEIGDNIDMYASHNADMRKGLNLLVEANSEWQLQLRRLKEQSPPEELERYSFVLTNAIDAVHEMADDARQELQKQNELAKQKKLEKVYSERRD